MSVDKLNDLVKEQGGYLSCAVLCSSSLLPGCIAQRVSHLEEDNKRLKETVELLLEEFSQVRNLQRSVRTSCVAISRLFTTPTNRMNPR